jgi:hypothetical protein
MQRLRGQKNHARKQRQARESDSHKCPGMVLFRNVIFAPNYTWRGSDWLST